MGDGAGVDLTVIPPSHSNGAAALLLGDVGRQDAVTEHGVIQVQVALLLLIRQHSNCLAAVFVLREDITVVADAHIRARPVLTRAVGLAETSVCGTFVYVLASPASSRCVPLLALTVV